MGLWIKKRIEGKNPQKVCWDVELTKGDSGYITVTLTDMLEKKIALRDEDVVKAQVRTEQGALVFEGIAERTTDGGLIWHIYPENTQCVEVGEYVWDMEVELYDSNDVFTFIPLSMFEILPESTRRCKN